MTDDDLAALERKLESPFALGLSRKKALEIVRELRRLRAERAEAWRDVPLKVTMEGVGGPGPSRHKV